MTGIAYRPQPLNLVSHLCPVHVSHRLMLPFPLTGDHAYGILWDEIVFQQELLTNFVIFPHFLLFIYLVGWGNGAYGSALRWANQMKTWIIDAFGSIVFIHSSIINYKQLNPSISCILLSRLIYTKLSCVSILSLHQYVVGML